MADDKGQWASISGRPTHGTATPVSFSAVVPLGKSEKEVFWVRELVRRLPGFPHGKTVVRANEDDSAGNHDVVIETNAQLVLGVQVTELTYELWRKRSIQRDRYLQKIVYELQRIGALAPARFVANVHFSTTNPRELELVPAEEIATLVASEANGLSTRKIVETRFGRVLFSPAGEADIYVPCHGNIGVNVDIDELPRSLEMYTTAIDCLVEKKMQSKSPWLVIWSVAFYRDKHFLGNEVINYMKRAFQGAPFSRVYLIESMDGEGFFEANITVYAVKE
jgi:hypothetical protein